jgi:hypothetical protein
VYAKGIGGEPSTLLDEFWTAIPLSGCNAFHPLNRRAAGFGGESNERFRL